MINRRVVCWAFSAFLSMGASVAWANDAAPSTRHEVGAAKLIVSDLEKTQAFYQEFFGMKEVARFSAVGVYEEPILGLESGARLALFQPLSEPALKKPRAPVVLFYVPNFDELVGRIEAAKHSVYRLSAAEAGTFKIAIVRDPSDNAVEIFARAGRPLEVGGAKLIVDSREQAEQFYTQVFDIKPAQRFQRKEYDEVIGTFGSGAFLALFEPKNEAPLAKSRFPVIAIYTTQFDLVLERLKNLGVSYRDIKSSTPGQRIIVANDPAGNAVEVISR